MSAITETWYTFEQIQQLKSFLNQQELTANERLMMNEYLLKTEQNFQFYRDNAVELGKWFNKQSHSDEEDFEMTSLERRPIRMPDFKMWNTIGRSRIDKFFESKGRHVEMESAMSVKKIIFSK
ncbi:hypothetical protein HELRODRAFT_163492 [Helobdella robusta]|uniref:Uncharacterized protein n=1 Tax=Helobdella robusta TaxID=6412 RepID=T1EU47_HELRO|nr:hypothetical protein HELRODRAFT_163492 [Helobdella robusta]ESN96432.1 hypothetical protein HELRODRAFT_163492 [Helobdella robusta]